MDGWKTLSEFSERERTKLRWLLRNARENGIVEAGVAMKFGCEWRINAARLPDFLIQQTHQRLKGLREDSDLPRSRA